jgi:hypothetical protein
MNSEDTPLLSTRVPPIAKPSLTADDLFFSRTVEDDVVTLGVKKLCLSVSVTSLCCLCSFFLLMMDYLFPAEFHGGFVRVILFAPMWVGTIMGIVAAFTITYTVYKNAVLISRERRLYMRENLDSSESSKLYIDYDSLPLMRKLLCWNILIFIALWLILASQVMFAFWFVYGAIGLWNALIPAFIVAAIGLIYIFVVNVMSLRSAVFVVIGFFQMV